jgi:ECM component-binding autotransporter adhesin
MAINFPDAPSTGDEFTSGDRTWKWDGTTWETVGAGFTATSPVVLTGADFSFDSTSIETNAADIATNVTDIQANADAIAVNITDIQTNADALASLEVVDITDITATAVELNYVDGVTSAIQEQLDGKAQAGGGGFETNFLLMGA